MRLLYNVIDMACLKNWDFAIPTDTTPWTEEEQEKFINNLLEGCPIPQLTICTRTRQMIDGCQVLDALKLLAVRLEMDKSQTIRRSLAYWHVPYVDLMATGETQDEFEKKVNKAREMINRGRE